MSGLKPVWQRWACIHKVSYNVLKIIFKVRDALTAKRPCCSEDKAKLVQLVEQLASSMAWIVSPLVLRENFRKTVCPQMSNVPLFIKKSKS